MKTKLVFPELHAWKCRLFLVYDECFIVSVICDTVMTYHMLQRDNIVNCILAVSCVIIVFRHPILLLDGECSSVSLDGDIFV